jgi:hypothetical protein
MRRAFRKNKLVYFGRGPTGLVATFLPFQILLVRVFKINQLNVPSSLSTYPARSPFISPPS